MSELSTVALDAEGDWSPPAPARVEAAPAPWVWTTARLTDLHAGWQAEMDQLVDHADLPELASGSWWSAFWEGFHPGDRQVEMQLLHQDGRLRAAFPVRTEGRLVRRRVGLENAHAPYWAAAVDPRALERDPALAGALLDRLTGGVECLELRRLPLDGPLARALKAAASARRWPMVELTNPVGEVGLPLFGPWSNFHQTLSKNLRRDGRLLARLPGELSFEVVEGGDRLEAELDACFALEARGWKGQLGTPVLADRAAHRFYRRLAQRASARGRLALYLLKLDGRLIAFEYDLRGGGRIECLKIGYDESLSRYSPGTGLRMLILRQAIERGEAREYRLGRESEWKRRWVSDLTRIGTLQVYAGSRRGRLAYYAGPALRSLLKRLPGVQPLVASVRRGLEAAADRLLRLRRPAPPPGKST
jgi:CelD/BcsL family acetyltransferase involved in cellulose biosynthesis